MLPLHQLLKRIRWDPEFGRGRFRIAYADHLAGGLVAIELSEFHVDPDNPFMFDVIDETGEKHSIPFHRVKQVFKDDVLIWQRQAR